MGVKGAKCPLTVKNLPKNQEKGKTKWEKEEKLGRKAKNQEGSFTLSLLTDTVGYATVNCLGARLVLCC